MKTLSLSAAVLILAAAAIGQRALSPADMSVLEGKDWTGELTYLDYRSNKKTSIRSKLTVTRKGGSSWSFFYEYPDEPKANSTGEVALLPDGLNFNGQKVVSTHKLETGALEVVTEKEGEDNSRKAMFRYTYTISQKSLSIRKDVRIDGTAEWFERNTYNWSRP